MHSYSALKLYMQCPARHKYQRILKLPGAEVNRTAADRGSLLHQAAEHYILKKTDDLPSELLKWEKVLNKLREDGTIPEMVIELPEHNLKGILDTVNITGSIAEVADWKSGSERDYSMQLRFYAMLLMLAKPEISEVRTRVRYLDKGKSVIGTTYTRKALSAIKQEFDAMLQRMETDPVRAPNPSSLCAFCPYKKPTGGPCKWG